VSLVVGLALVAAGAAFALVKLAPCAFADSRSSTDGILATAERWLEVEQPVPDVHGMLPDGNGLARVELLVRHLDADGVTSSTVVAEGVAIDDVFLRQIRPALDDGSRVFLALASKGLVREMVAYVVARRTDGTHRFLSGCGIDLTAETRDMLGSRFDAAIRQVIGLTDRADIFRVLADVEEAPGLVLVTYEEYPSDLRSFSRTGTLAQRGRCLALKTDVGPLVPIWHLDEYFLAIDEKGLVVMSGLDRAFRLGDRLELAGREMSPGEALAVTDKASLRYCPGRLILVASVSSILATP
jgi:hypothetical protein